MALSTRKITYTSEFKLKVLDYYFKNGGDDNFGLKKKTASHFNIDKKTINRMLKNTDMVKRAQKLLAKRLASASARAQAKTTPPTPEKASTSSSSSKTAKATTSKAGTSGAGGSTKGTGKSTAGSNSKNSVGPGGSRASASSSSSSSSTNKTTASTKQSGGGGGSQATSRTKNVNHGTANKKSVPVFELPEDPDYSVLKPSIAASTNSVAMIAKALISGTPEVRNVLLNECEMILECKVCRNLFRSLVNFLAHKRIYCQDEYAGVRSLFHKDPVQGLTSQSHTLIVEPELPPDYYNPGLLPPGASDHQGRGGRGGIDSIAERLAGNRQTLSHPTHTGSSQYHGILDGVSRTRDRMSRECTVVLEDIAGVTTARYQTFAPPIPTPTTTVPMSALLDQVAHHSVGITLALDENGDIVETARGDVNTMTVAHHSAGITLALDENGDIVETARGDVHTMSIPPSNATYSSQDLVCDNCNTRFASHKTLSVHMRSQHQFQRFVYVCPICRSSFYNMFSVIKHLQHAHKKTKHQLERLWKEIKKKILTHKKTRHQLERLRKVIKKNVQSKTFFVNKDGKEEEKEDEQIEEEEEEEDEDEETEKMEVGSPSKSPQKSSLQKSSPQKSPQKASPNPRRPSPSKASSSKGWRSRGGMKRWSCNVCAKLFLTRVAAMAHVATHIICDFEPKAELVTVTEGNLPQTGIKTTTDTSGHTAAETGKIRQTASETSGEASAETSRQRAVREAAENNSRSRDSSSSDSEASSDSSTKLKDAPKSTPVKKSAEKDTKKSTENAENKRKVDGSVKDSSKSKGKTIAGPSAKLSVKSTGGLRLKISCDGLMGGKKKSPLSSDKKAKKPSSEKGSVSSNKSDHKPSTVVSNNPETVNKPTDIDLDITQTKPLKNAVTFSIPTGMSSDVYLGSKNLDGDLDPDLDTSYPWLETQYSSGVSPSWDTRPEADIHQSASELGLFEDWGDDEPETQYPAEKIDVAAPGPSDRGLSSGMVEGSRVDREVGRSADEAKVMKERKLDERLGETSGLEKDLKKGRSVVGYTRERREGESSRTEEKKGSGGQETMKAEGEAGTSDETNIKSKKRKRESDEKSKADGTNVEGRETKSMKKESSKDEEEMKEETKVIDECESIESPKNKDVKDKENREERERASKKETSSKVEARTSDEDSRERRAVLVREREGSTGEDELKYQEIDSKKDRMNVENKSEEEIGIEIGNKSETIATESTDRSRDYTKADSSTSKQMRNESERASIQPNRNDSDDLVTGRPTSDVDRSEKRESSVEDKSSSICKKNDNTNTLSTQSKATYVAPKTVSRDPESSNTKVEKRRSDEDLTRKATSGTRSIERDSGDNSTKSKIAERTPAERGSEIDKDRMERRENRVELTEDTEKRKDGSEEKKGKEERKAEGTVEGKLNRGLDKNEDWAKTKIDTKREGRVEYSDDLKEAESGPSKHGTGSRDGTSGASRDRRDRTRGTSRDRGDKTSDASRDKLSSKDSQASRDQSANNDGLSMGKIGKVRRGSKDGDKGSRKETADKDRRNIDDRGNIKGGIERERTASKEDSAMDKTNGKERKSNDGPSKETTASKNTNTDKTPGTFEARNKDADAEDFIKLEDTAKDEPMDDIQIKEEDLSPGEQRTPTTIPLLDYSSSAVTGGGDGSNMDFQDIPNLNLAPLECSNNSNQGLFEEDGVSDWRLDKIVSDFPNWRLDKFASDFVTPDYSKVNSPKPTAMPKLTRTVMPKLTRITPVAASVPKPPGDPRLVRSNTADVDQTPSSSSPPPPPAEKYTHVRSRQESHSPPDSTQKSSLNSSNEDECRTQLSSVTDSPLSPPEVVKYFTLFKPKKLAPLTYLVKPASAPREQEIQGDIKTLLKSVPASSEAVSKDCREDSSVTSSQAGDGALSHKDTKSQTPEQRQSQTSSPTATMRHTDPKQTSTEAVNKSQIQRAKNSSMQDTDKTDKLTDKTEKISASPSQALEKAPAIPTKKTEIKDRIQKEKTLASPTETSSEPAPRVYQVHREKLSNSNQISIKSVCTQSNKEKQTTSQVTGKSTPKSGVDDSRIVTPIEPTSPQSINRSAPSPDRQTQPEKMSETISPKMNKSVPKLIKVRSASSDDAKAQPSTQPAPNLIKGKSVSLSGNLNQRETGSTLPSQTGKNVIVARSKQGVKVTKKTETHSSTISKAQTTQDIHMQGTSKMSGVKDVHMQGSFKMSSKMSRVVALNLSRPGSLLSTTQASTTVSQRLNPSASVTVPPSVVHSTTQLTKSVSQGGVTKPSSAQPVRLLVTSASTSVTATKSHNPSSVFTSKASSTPVTPGRILESPSAPLTKDEKGVIHYNIKQPITRPSEAPTSVKDTKHILAPEQPGSNLSDSVGHQDAKKLKMSSLASEKAKSVPYRREETQCSLKSSQAGVKVLLETPSSKFMPERSIQNLPPSPQREFLTQMSVVKMLTLSSGVSTKTETDTRKATSSESTTLSLDPKKRSREMGEGSGDGVTKKPKSQEPSVFSNISTLDVVERRMNTFKIPRKDSLVHVGHSSASSSSVTESESGSKFDLDLEEIQRRRHLTKEKLNKEIWKLMLTAKVMNKREADAGSTSQDSSKQNVGAGKTSQDSSKQNVGAGKTSQDSSSTKPASQSSKPDSGPQGLGTQSGLFKPDEGKAVEKSRVGEFSQRPNVDKSAARETQVPKTSISTKLTMSTESKDKYEWPSSSSSSSALQKYDNLYSKTTYQVAGKSQRPAKKVLSVRYVYRETETGTDLVAVPGDSTEGLTNVAGEHKGKMDFQKNPAFTLKDTIKSKSDRERVPVLKLTEKKVIKSSSEGDRVRISERDERRAGNDGKPIVSTTEEQSAVPSSPGKLTMVGSKLMKTNKDDPVTITKIIPTTTTSEEHKETRDRIPVISERPIKTIATSKDSDSGSMKSLTEQRKPMTEEKGKSSREFECSAGLKKTVIIVKGNSSRGFASPAGPKKIVNTEKGNSSREIESTAGPKKTVIINKGDKVESTAGPKETVIIKKGDGSREFESTAGPKKTAIEKPGGSRDPESLAEQKKTMALDRSVSGGELSSGASESSNILALDRRSDSGEGLSSSAIDSSNNETTFEGGDVLRDDAMFGGLSYDYYDLN